METVAETWTVFMSRQRNVFLYECQRLRTASGEPHTCIAWLYSLYRSNKAWTERSQTCIVRLWAKISIMYGNDIHHCIIMISGENIIIPSWEEKNWTILKVRNSCTRWHRKTIYIYLWKCSARIGNKTGVVNSSRLNIHCNSPAKQCDAEIIIHLSVIHRVTDN